MPNFCAIVDCSSRGGRDKKSFFCMPTIITTQGEQTQKLSERRQREWASAIGRKDLKESQYPYTRVCSDHFITGKSAKLYEQTSPDWVPSVNMCHNKTILSPPCNRLKRHERNIERETKKRKITAARSLLEFQQQPLEINESVDYEYSMNGKSSLACQTELTSRQIGQSEENHAHVVNDLESLTIKFSELQIKVSNSSIKPESFQRDDDKVRFYTGLLNYLTLMAVFSLVEEYITDTGRTALSKFQQMILTLMKLRLNSSLQDLAYRFDVSRTTVSRVFSSVIDIMSIRMKSLIYWPDRESLQKSMPMDFRKNFGTRVAIIIDCFEVFCETPSNGDAKRKTWSNYKHHNTVKFLIGITPQGVISYISKAWGGRTSDKHLTEHCGFLSHLLPGDVVLADRGLTIADSVALMCAELNIPAFTKGRKQLSALDVEQTRKIANVRIHVERVIGNLRQKYTILKEVLPIDFLSTRDTGIDRDSVHAQVDKISIICCALCNLGESLVPFS